MTTVLQNMKRIAMLSNKRLPYIYEQFNVFTFTQSPLTSESFARIYNAFIDACNRRMKMPHYIIIVPDRDLIEAANFYNFGVKKLLGICTNWLAKQIERDIDSRRERLGDRRPGALLQAPTQIIWVKMLQRPPVPLDDKKYKTQATRDKFNSTLDQLPDWRRDTSVLEITSLHHTRDYDAHGNLKECGKRQYWREFDYLFKIFDRENQDKIEASDNLRRSEAHRQRSTNGSGDITQGARKRLHFR